LKTGSKRIAVVLFNLGGPDKQEHVRPFLRNLFCDPAIIDLPFGLRHILAEFISRRRETEAKANYQLMGGGSPLCAETKDQVLALEQELIAQYPEKTWLCVMAMRYWYPRAKTTLQKIIDFMPDEVVLLPLYPQFSYTTSGSSFEEWIKLTSGKNWKTKKVISYEVDNLFIQSHVKKIISTWELAKKPENIRILFSAHGLPKKNIEKGDPYQEQIEATVAAIVDHLPDQLQDTEICYQSRVGRLQWIEPSTIQSVEAAGKEKKNLLVVPVSFVSEHIETLVELDMEIAEIAKASGVKIYLRAETLKTHPDFISSLVGQIQKAGGYNSK